MYNQVRYSKELSIRQGKREVDNDEVTLEPAWGVHLDAGFRAPLLTAGRCLSIHSPLQAGKIRF